MPTSKSSQIRVPTFYLEGTESHLQENEPEALENFPAAQRAAGEARNTIGEIRGLLQQAEKVRRRNLEDPTTTDIGGRVKTYKFVENKVKKPLFQKSNRVESALGGHMGKLDKKINHKIEAEAKDPHTAEARQHVKSLDKKSERLKFIRQAVDSEDWFTVSAVLGSPPYLSGLDREHQENLKDYYRKERFSEEMRVREYLESLSRRIGKGYRAALSNLDIVESREVKRALKLNEQAKKAMR